MRQYYKDLSFGQMVRVQAFYGELLDSFYTGAITNMDGQNIVVEVKDREIPKHSFVKDRAFEVCNPDYAIVEAI